MQLKEIEFVYTKILKYIIFSYFKIKYDNIDYCKYYYLKILFP